MRTKKKQSSYNNDLYYMYGNHPVIAAIKNKSRDIKQIYCLPKYFHEIKSYLPNSKVETVENDFIIKKIGKNQTHQGIIALVKPIFKYGIEHLNLKLPKHKIAILDQISDPQNIGAIIRSAAAFGIKTIILPIDNSPEESAIIAKTACGCLELVEIIKVINLKKTIDILKNNGFWIVGLDATGQKDTKSLQEIDKIAFVIGSEGKGMRTLISKSCDFLIQIPISENVESLNASNAASIVFYLMR
jgi:23S rRNA (guanosine2251-2'-O)-methyltransferase